MAWFRVPPLGVRAYIFINNSHLLLTTPINSDIILLYFKKGETMNDIWGLAISALFLYVFGRLLIETAIQEGEVPLLIFSVVLAILVMWWQEKR